MALKKKKKRMAQWSVYWTAELKYTSSRRQSDIRAASAWKAMANYQVYNCLFTSLTSRSEPALKSRSRIPV